MILLVAMVGAIVLTFRKREGVKKQSYIKQISRERSEGVQVLEVETNKGVKIDEWNWFGTLSNFGCSYFFNWNYRYILK